MGLGWLRTNRSQRRRRFAHAAGAEAVLPAAHRSRLQRHGHTLCGQSLRARPSPADGRPHAGAAATLSRRPYALSRSGLATCVQLRHERVLPRGSLTAPITNPMTSNTADRRHADAADAADDRDHFISVRKTDILDALIDHGHLADDPRRAGFP